MKIELGQFYLRDGTVFLFLQENDEMYWGKAWQGGLLHSFNTAKTGGSWRENLTPITPEIAKLALFSQDPKP